MRWECAFFAISQNYVRIRELVTFLTPVAGENKIADHFTSGIH
jgi:hypothetical protein